MLQQLLNMAEHQSLILNQPPKKLEYLNKLLQYDPPTTLYEKAKTWITKQEETRPHSISKWCEIVGSTSNNDNTRGFFEKLVEEEALVYEDTIGEPPNENEIYSLDKARLEEVMYNDPFWEWIKLVSFRVINNQEPNRKIVKDY